MGTLSRFFASVALAAGLALALVAPPANADDAIDPATAAAAGQYYLNVICRSNASIGKFTQARERAESRGWEDGDKPTKAMRKAARKASRGTTRAARQLVRYTWPESVSFDVQSLAEDLYEDAGVYGGIARGDRSWTWYSSGAATRIRLALGLGPANTDFDGCSK